MRPMTVAAILAGAIQADESIIVPAIAPKLEELSDEQRALALPRIEHILEGNRLAGVKNDKVTLVAAVAEVVNGLAPWPDPVPLGDIQTAPDVETEPLPPVLGSFVDALAIAFQVPKALALVAVLGAVATAVQRKVVVEVRHGWQEPVNVFLAVFADPSHRKTPVMNSAMDPVMAYERERAAAVKPLIAEYRNARANLEEQLKRVRKALGGARTDEKREELSRLTQDLTRQIASLGEEPRAPVLHVGDTTDSGLPPLLAEHGGKMTIATDEGNVFKSMGGIYLDGNASFDTLKQSYTGTRDVRVNRKNGGLTIVHMPTVTVAAMVQPAVLRGALSHPAFAGEGLISRFAFLLPESNLGSRMIGAPPVPPDVKGGYIRAIRALLELEPARDDRGNARPHVVVMTVEAGAVIMDFEREIEPQLGTGGALDGTDGFGGKVAGLVVRVAGLFHMAEHAHSPYPWGERIAADTVKRAVALVRQAFLPHTLIALSYMHASRDTDRAGKIITWLKRNGLREFSRAQLHNDLKGILKGEGPEAWEPPLKQLWEANYIRPRTEPTSEKRGRGRPPTTVYDVNPKLLAEGGAA